MTEQEKTLIDQLSNDAVDSTCRAEKEKAEYWICKRADACRAEWEKEPIQYRLLAEDRSCIASPIITYQGKLFQHAVVFCAYRNTGMLKYDKNYFLIYGEGQDLGIIYPEVDDNGQRTLRFFTSEFFYKLEEVLGDKHDNRIDTIRQFFASNVCYHNEMWKDDNGDEYPVCVFGSYIAVGRKESESRYIMTSFLLYAEQQTAPYVCIEDTATVAQQAQFCKSVEAYRELYNDTWRDAMEEKYGDIDTESWQKHVPVEYAIYLWTIWQSRNPNWHTNDATKEVWQFTVLAISDLICDVTDKKVAPPNLAHHDAYYKFFTDCITQYVKGYIESTNRLEYASEKLAETATKILWHKQYDIELEEVKKYLDTTPAWKGLEKRSKDNKQKTTIMDKRMREHLRRITKSYGLRDKYENLIKDTRTTVEAWFDWVESIYAISRLRPYITNEKDRPKFLAADKEWIAYIVENDKCGILQDYVNEYGKPAVIQAIHYLMDNDLWEAPLGIEGIRKANAELYKGVAAIKEAVDYLKSEGLLEAEAEEATVEAVSAPETNEPEQSATGKHTDAQKAFDGMKEAFAELQRHFTTLEGYVNEDELTDMLERENTKLTKENDRLTESIKTVNQQYNDAKKELERQKQRAYDAEKANNATAVNFEKLMKQYEELKGNYEFLKKEAQKADDTPKAKIIPLSKLIDLPLIGKSVLKSLVPFLKQYNIVVDEKR